MSDIIQKEVSTNFVPSLPRNLQKDRSQKGLATKIKETLAKTSSPQEIQDQTQILYDLLVKRVELRIDLARHPKHYPSETAQQTAMSLQDRLDLIKQGDLRTAIPEIAQDTQKRTIESDVKELREVEEHISNLISDPQVAEQYSRFRENRINKLRSAREASECHTAIKLLRLQQEKMARATFLEDRQYSPGEQRVIDENRQIVNALTERIDTLTTDPEIFDLVRLRELQSYQRGLKTDRFAETPSREQYIDTVRQQWAQGKKVLLTGPTGGGKTELLLHASRSLFGQEAERLTGHELMTNYEVYGKTKGGVKEGQVVLMFGSAPFIRAIERNTPFVFDEINVVPNKILMRLKTDLNARFGQQVTIQEDSDKQVIIGDKFAVGATENVKSEKHSEREKLDPALVRMFESTAIDYFPPPELYDIMLASLMDVRGGVKLSKKDATETLHALCNATEWIQRAYLGQTINTAPDKILSARGQESIGKPATLREAILDPGKAIDMLTGWEDAQREGRTFREFLNRRIVAFINNENFPEEDRYYLTEVFALQGFLQGVKAGSLRVPGLDQTTLDTWSGYDGKHYIPKSQYIPPEIVAQLDPYNKLKRPASVAAKDLLDEEETVEEIIETETSQTPTMSGIAKNRAPISPATSPSTSGLSIEGRRALDTLDTLFPPSKLPTVDEDRYQAYPDALINTATSNPTTLPAVLTRFSGILDGTQPDGYDINSLVNRLSKLVPLAKKDPQAKQLIAAIIFKIDQSPVWRRNTGVIKRNNDVLAQIEKEITS